LTNAENLFDHYNGTLLFLYGSFTYNYCTANQKWLTLPYQLEESSLQLPPGGSANYNLTIPQPGSYTPFIHLVVADAIVELRVYDESSLIAQANLTKRSKIDAWNVWEYRTGGNIYLAKGSYQLTLTNKGPSFIISDLYGFVKISNESGETKSITFSRYSSDHVSVNGVGQNFYIVFGQVYNDGWSARQGGKALEHLRGFFFLNTFYVDKLDRGTSIDITYSDKLIRNLIVVSEVTFFIFVGVLIATTCVKKRIKKILQAGTKTICKSRQGLVT
jgi:hypothetical protein